MNQKSAIALNGEIFNEQKLSFSETHGQSKLFVDFQSRPTDLEKFYPLINKDLSEVAPDVLASYETDRNELCDILLDENDKYNAGKKTLKNIKKLRRDDCLAVLTGQQAGLFSGPVYTIYKALSAIKLAENLTSNGLEAVPVFWIASEDHDFDEISRTFIINNEEALYEISNRPDYEIDGVPIGYLEIDKSIENSFEVLFENLKPTEFTKEIYKLLTNTYKIGETFSTAFGKLLASIFKDYGLIFVSPLNENLRKLSSPIYQKAIENSEAIKENLLTRNDELKEKKYHSQVLVENDFFPFFYIDKNNKRISLRRDNEKQTIKSQDSVYEFTQENLIEIAQNSPHSLSPNALMRPVIQDYLLPTICYFGGGAEIAYFGQNSVIYRVLDRPVTPIRHRASFSIIEGKYRRTLNKYKLSFADLFAGEERILAEIIEKYLNPETAQVFAESEEIINTQLQRLDQYLTKVDPTLSNNLANRQRKILWHLETLRNKFYRAERLNNQVINRRIDGLFTNLLPNNSLQERTLNVLHFFNLYGENFIQWLYDAVDSEEQKHQIIIF